MKYVKTLNGVFSYRENNPHTYENETAMANSAAEQGGYVNIEEDDGYSNIEAHTAEPDYAIVAF